MKSLLDKIILISTIFLLSSCKDTARGLGLDFVNKTWKDKVVSPRTLPTLFRPSMPTTETFSKHHLGGWEGREEHLNGWHIENVTLYRINLMDIDLNGATLINVKINGKLSNLSFRNAILLNVEFIEDNQTGFQNELRNVDFTGAKILDSKFGKTAMYGVTFNDVKIEYSNFGNVEMSDIDFINAEMDGVQFDNRAVLRSVVFIKSILMNMSFSSSSLKDVLFNDSVMCRVDFYNSSMINTHSEGTTMINTYLEPSATIDRSSFDDECNSYKNF